MTSGLSGSPAAMTSRRLCWTDAEIFLDQHAPHRRRRAQRGDLDWRDDRLEQRLGVEARLVVGEHRRAGVPGREEAAPGVLRPARRGDVEMHVAGQQAEPVHRREMADRIGAVRVQHELGLRRRAGGEIEQHRIVGVGLAVGRERGGRLQEIVVAMPARRRVADRDPGQLLLEAVEFRGVGRRRSRHGARARARTGRRDRPASATSSPE